MNKTVIEKLNDTISEILIDALARDSAVIDIITSKIMRHVENALEDAYDKGRSEGYEEGHEDGYLECEQEYSERESEY